MLTLNNIEVIYSDVILVLKGVSLSVQEGNIVSLLGANGAGKSTALKAISGLLKTELGEVTDGNIEFEGRILGSESPEEIVKMGIVQVMEGRPLFEQLTVEENIRVGAYSRNDTDVIKNDMEDVYGYFPILARMRHRVSGYLSGGERQMLVMGRGLMARPKLMLMDEPSLGLSPALVKEIFRIIERINKEQNTSILLVEQNAAVALSISDHAYVMENGRIVLDGPSSKLKENEDIKEFYLGLSQVGKRKSYKDVKHYRRRKRWLS
ncbi:MAG: ABC transporter ATP-binding protein [Deltaproteobacteria bacterium]|nr:ABC transporter ATP-binding protein [Deltaproteobacteria bacterium]MBW2119091.1 ABC transporter ATP-binding protein [Deltaproteobacteria bacterium]MBW2343740.1 ABC transporter ATP-binding protein [Deltaproteobacteria bacterium]